MKAVFLDRDGILNKAKVIDGKPYPPASIRELVIDPATIIILENLKKFGFLLIGATNQPDVARGKSSKENVEEIHQALMSKLPLDEIYVCYHDDADCCECRKPKPGLLLQAAKKFNINLADSFIIGDRWRDIDAGRFAKCTTIFVDYGYAEKQPEIVDYRIKSLNEAVKLIIRE